LPVLFDRLLMMAFENQIERGVVVILGELSGVCGVLDIVRHTDKADSSKAYTPRSPCTHIRFVIDPADYNNNQTNYIGSSGVAATNRAIGSWL
jgi:hypothetical protein